MAGEHYTPEEWAELTALGESEAPTAEELAEARLLALASQGKHQVALSDDAELGLGLLRVATQGELGQEAKQRIWGEIALPKNVRIPERLIGWERKWLLFAGLVPAAAAGLLYWQSTAGESSGGARVMSRLPTPTPELLAAQAKWVTSSDEREPFERSMSSYRLAVLEGLD